VSGKRSFKNGRIGIFPVSIYIWADEIYCDVRMKERQCLLVIIGAVKSLQKDCEGNISMAQGN